MISSCALKTSSMKWTGRRSCEVLKRLLVTQTQFPVRPSPQLFISNSWFICHPLASLQALKAPTPSHEWEADTKASFTQTRHKHEVNSVCCCDLLVGTREKKIPAHHSGNSPSQDFGKYFKLFLHTSSVIKSQNTQHSQGQKGPSHQRKLVSESISDVVIIKMVGQEI